MFFILVAATYTLHLLQNQSIQHDDLYTTKHIYQTMKKHVTLADGRQVLCNIPVFKEQFDFKPKVVTNLTREQVSQLLYPLENMCVHHRTFEFLYEYCFRKYVRQFDDQLTKLNMNKILIEDFSLGYEEEFNNLTNKSTNIKHPLQHSYNIDSIINNIPHKSYVLIDGCIAKLRGEFKLDPSDSISRMIEIESQSKTYKFHILNVFNSYFAILEDCSDELLISSKVIYHQSNLQYLKYEEKLIYNIRNLIFSQKFRAQHQFQVNQTLGVVFYEKIHLVKVTKIHDYGVIEVTGLRYQNTKNKRQIPQIIKNLIILDGSDQYQITNYDIWISNQVLFFDFREILDVGDQIVLYDNLQMSFTYNFRINKMYKDQVAILDKQFTQNLSYYGKAIIRKSSLFQDQQLYRQDYGQHLSNLTVYKLDKLDQDYQFYITGNGYFSGFTFQLVNSLLAKKKKLEIVIKSKKYTDTSIIFLQMPVEMIYLVHSKGHADMEPRFRNNTIFKGQFWVVIDTLDDVIYFGRGRQINLRNRMLYLKLQRVRDLEETFTIVIKQSSQGLKLLDLTELPLTNYINMNYSDQLKGYFHALNYSLKLEAVYSERYNNGTLCEPVHRGRRSQVNFQCDHDNLMIFKSITEPATCDYEITIGTYLMCENQRNISIPEDKHIMCVLQ